MIIKESLVKLVKGLILISLVIVNQSIIILIQLLNQMEPVKIKYKIITIYKEIILNYKPETKLINIKVKSFNKLKLN
jgi:hypothetical protein